MSTIILDSQPRVNAGGLDKQVGREVILVGAVVSSAGNELHLNASDKQQVRVLLPAHLQLPAGKFLEVTGKVQGDKSVRLTGVTALGDNFDLDTYNDAIIAAAAFPTVF